MRIAFLLRGIASAAFLLWAAQGLAGGQAVPTLAGWLTATLLLVVPELDRWAFRLPPWMAAPIGMAIGAAMFAVVVALALVIGPAGTG